MCIFLFTGFLYKRNCFITNLLVEVRVNYSRLFSSFVKELSTLETVFLENELFATKSCKKLQKKVKWTKTNTFSSLKWLLCRHYNQVTVSECEKA